VNAPPPALDGLVAHLFPRVRAVRQHLGLDAAAADDPGTRFADLLDSMGMVEFLLVVAEDCGARPADLEQCVGRRFGTVAELACGMHAAGLVPGPGRPEARTGPLPQRREATGEAWLAATAVCLPEAVEPAAKLDEALGLPAGWLEDHAGIRQRRLWSDQDPLAAAADAGRKALGQAHLLTDDVGALLVTSEAPPLPVGLAAALHHRLDLRPEAVALEIGGACTGFLAALWVAQSLLARAGTVLVLAVEAPSRYLFVQPGEAGKAAALFGDAAAAAVVTEEAPGAGAVRLADVEYGAEGAAGHLIQVRRPPAGGVELHLAGEELAGRAVKVMAEAVRDLAGRHGLALADLHAVVAHGGNGRMPALLARRLGLPAERVWSETAQAGNLGSASLPAAWAAHQPPPRGPVVWAGVGAGLTWGAALTGHAGSGVILT
jgi:3-oxoacyl-[acyl-carrier-protein] synthase-3